jgi:RNA polymerase sigma factor (sigma-70 family)
VDEDFAAYAHARYAHLVRSASLILGRDRAGAEDLVQEALARTLSRSRGTTIDNLDAFVRRTMVNLAISRSRRDKVGRSVTRRLHRPGDDIVEPDNPERLSPVWAAVERLPSKQRAVIVLRYYEDLEFADIADLLKISPVTARTQCLRARDALRTALEDQHEVRP